MFLWALTRRSNQLPTGTPLTFEQIRIGELAVAIVVGAGFLLFAFTLTALGPLVLLLLLGPLYVIGSLLSVDGELDSEEHRIRLTSDETDEEVTLPLDAVSDFRHLTVGTVTVYWLSYEPDVEGGITRRLFAAPTALHDRIGAALEAGRARESTIEHSGTDRRNQAIVASFGVTFLAFSVVLLLFGSRELDEPLLLTFPVLFLAFFGATLLYLARFGSRYF